MHGTEQVGNGNKERLHPDMGGTDVSVDVIEISGVVKWFDIAKGYGFIVPDNGLADVLLHAACLRRDGYETAYEGAKVKCEAVARPKGLQVWRILSMDESTAVIKTTTPQPSRRRPNVKNVFGPSPATVKWFNALRGFGFLTMPDESDVFVHKETLRARGFSSLSVGQIVFVSYGPNEDDPHRRLIAVDVLQEQPGAE